jgi:hypothetical protein
MTPEESGGAARSRDGWNVPKPERIPEPTFWPAALALGIVFVCFGLLTSYLFSLVGAGLMALSITRWIGELLRGD